MDLWGLTLFILAGVAGGLLLGLIGVGMALVTVPFLTFMLPSLGFSTEVSPVIALASSMLIAAIGSVSSLRVHHQKAKQKQSKLLQKKLRRFRLKLQRKPKRLLTL